MVQVLEVCVSFINVGKYNSQERPIFALFPAMPAGDPIEDFSVHHSQGMTRTLACKIIVETVFDMDLDDDDFIKVLPLVVSCLWVKYVYDPAPTYEEEIDRSIIKKFQVSEAARPTVLQLLATFMTEFRMSGKEQSNDAIMNRIKEFNRKSQVEGQNISSLEAKAIVMLSGMSSSFIDVLKHHWQNFKSPESAITLGVLTDPENFFSDIRPGPGNIWHNIYEPTQDKAASALRYHIDFFCKNLKAARDRGKKKLQVPRQTFPACQPGGCVERSVHLGALQAGYPAARGRQGIRRDSHELLPRRLVT